MVTVCASVSTEIYAGISRPRPRFAWVASPCQALPLIAGWPTLGQLFALIRDLHQRGKPPLASDLAMSVSRMRGALSAWVVHADPALSPVRCQATRPRCRCAGTGCRKRRGLPTRLAAAARVTHPRAGTTTLPVPARGPAARVAWWFGVRELRVRW